MTEPVKPPDGLATEDPLDSLRGAILTSPSMGIGDPRLAWIYGVVVGMDEQLLSYVAENNGWDAETVARLQRLHERYHRTEQFIFATTQMMTTVAKAKGE